MITLPESAGDGDVLARTRALYDTVAASYARALPDTSFEADVDLAMIRRLRHGSNDRPALA
jgi:hypothetical protein